MSATLSGLIALENASPMEDSPSTITFDGQMWLGPERILTGLFRYYNSSNISFPDIGQYFAWIHVSSYYFLFYTLILAGCEIGPCYSASTFQNSFSVRP